MGHFNEESILSLPSQDDLYLDRTDYADAAADLLAEQRRASLERCGLKVDTWNWPAADVDLATVYAVTQDGKIINTFRDAAAAYAYAYELAHEAEQ